MNCHGLSESTVDLFTVEHPSNLVSDTQYYTVHTVLMKHQDHPSLCF